MPPLDRVVVGDFTVATDGRRGGGELWGTTTGRTDSGFPGARRAAEFSLRGSGGALGSVVATEALETTPVVAASDGGANPNDRPTGSASRGTAELVRSEVEAGAPPPLGRLEP